MGTPPCVQMPSRAFYTGDENFQFSIWWPMSSLLFLGAGQKAVGGGGCFRIPPSPFQPYRLRFSTCAIEVSACIPAGKLPTQASARPQAGASPTCSGIHHPPCPSSPSCPPLRILGWEGFIGDWGQPGPALAQGHQAEMQPLRLLRPESEYRSVVW